MPSWGPRGLAAAAACWALVLMAALLDHLTGAPQGLVVGLYTAAYVAGGTLAARPALTGLPARTVDVDLPMTPAAAMLAVPPAAGTRRGAMLTGDNVRVVRGATAEEGIDEGHAHLPPEDTPRITGEPWPGGPVAPDVVGHEGSIALVTLDGLRLLRSSDR